MEFLKLLSYFPYDDIPALTETTRLHHQFDFFQLSHENEVIKRLAETHVKAIIREQRHLSPKLISIHMLTVRDVA